MSGTRIKELTFNFEFDFILDIWYVVDVNKVTALFSVFVNTECNLLHDHMIGLVIVSYV